MTINDSVEDYGELSMKFLERVNVLYQSYKPENLKGIENIEEEASHDFEKTVSTNLIIQDVSSKLKEMSRQALILRDVFNTKFYYLFDAIIYATNSKNYLMLAENARALFEHVGTLAYLSIETEVTAKHLRSTNSEKRFLIEFNQLVHHYNNLFYTNTSLNHGTRTSKEQNKLSFSNLFHKYLNKCLPNQRAKILENDYIFLSDFVHPNLGSNLLVSSGYLTEQSQIFITNDERKKLIERLFESLNRLFEIINDLNYRFLYAGNLIDNMYRISLQEHENVANLFSPLLASKGKVKAIIGDGKSPETAIYFPIARNITEEVDMCSQYIDRKSLDIESYKFEHLKNGWKYYSYKKRNKKIWFKTDMSLSL